ncbi:hypothetical protein L1887_11666 [Cichorium endivia]|nr:hypothetical protein L1887_11666 [Cichorium endivia]
MADQRGEEVRNKKTLLHGGGDETTEANEGATKVGANDDYDLDDLISYFKILNPDTYSPRILGTSVSKAHADVDLAGNASYGSIGGGEIFDDHVIEEDTTGIEGFDSHGVGSKRRTGSEFDEEFPHLPPIRMSPDFYSSDYVLADIRDGLGRDEVSETQEFARDTNRLDYFSVRPFDVFGDDHLTGIATYGGGVGGGGGGRRDHGIVVGSILNQERGSPTADAGNTDVTQQVPIEFFADNGGDDGETVIHRLEQEKGHGGGLVCDGDGEDGGNLVEARWWEEWWLLLRLWKIV